MAERVSKAAQQVSALIKEKEKYVSADQLRVLRKARAKFNRGLKAYTQMLNQFNQGQNHAAAHQDSQLTFNL